MIGYILLSIIIITLGWTTFNLTRKVERLETWVEDYAQRIQDTKQTLDEVDIKGSFSSDDEIGFAYETVRECIEQLTKKGAITYDGEEGRQTDSTEED